jgi:pSer/pThr/pTyr-binding forkhead associated (FHA) protein
VCTIGRLPSSDVSLTHDQKIGRSHARIRRSGTGYVLEDLDSRNGTFLERGYSVMQIMAPTPLENDDVIRISSVRLRFADEGEPSTTPAFPQAPAEQMAEEGLGISVEPVSSSIQPTVVRRDETVTRDGLPPPPPHPIASEPERDEIGLLRAEVDDLKREIHNLAGQVAELVSRVRQG